MGTPAIYRCPVRKYVKLAAWTSIALMVLGWGFAETPTMAGQRIAATSSADRSMHAGLVESPNRIRFYLAQGPGKKSGWYSAFLDLTENVLVPGAPLSIQVGDPSNPNQLHVTTIATSGHILRVSGLRDSNEHGRVEFLSLDNSSHKFPPGAGLSVVRHGQRRLLFAVTTAGKLIEVDLADGRTTIVDSECDAFLAGSHVSVLEENPDEVFVIDRRGNLVFYVRDPIRNWNGPLLIGTGFRAGSDIVLWRHPDGLHETQAAAVNAKGELRLTGQEKTGWRMNVAPGWVVPAGTPIGVNHTPVNIRMLGVIGDGTLTSMHLVNTEWRERPVARGYQYKTCVIFPGRSQFTFSIDAAGDLIASTSSNDVWRSQLIPRDGGDEHGTIMGRDFKTPSITTSEFRFWNRSQTDVQLRLYDARQPSSTRDQLLAAGQHIAMRLDSPVKRSLRTRLSQPPEPVVAVTEAESTDIELERVREVICDNPFEVELLKPGPNRRYLDQRHHKSPRLKLTDVSEISLGTFSLPRGIDLQPGSSIDIDTVRSAEARGVVTVRP